MVEHKLPQYTKSINELLFTHKSSPKLADYDAIGFDVDHALARYRQINITRHTYQAYSKMLVKDRGYPQEFDQVTDYQLTFQIIGMIIDFQTGLILKLANDLTVLRAYKGFQLQTMEQVYIYIYMYVYIYID